MNELALFSVLMLIFILVQRLSELAVAKRNTAALMARGAVEYGAEHYPYMVALHTAWVLALIIFGYDEQLIWGWVAFYAVLQVFRFWILTTLGKRWTTRVIIIDEPLVLAGPFKYFRHPNYMLVIAEIFVTPMMFGLWEIAILFSVLNAVMLYVRIKVEEKALASLR